VGLIERDGKCLRFSWKNLKGVDLAVSRRTVLKLILKKMEIIFYAALVNI
jgi:hypothetical protein